MVMSVIEHTNIKEVFFLTKEGGILILHAPFIKNYDDPALTSAFISAVSTFANQGVGKLERVGRVESDLIMLEGKHTVLAATVSKEVDLLEFRPKAEELLEEFEREYKWQLMELDGARNGYYKFTFDVYSKFPIYTIDKSVVFERTDVPLEKRELRGIAYEGLNKLLEAVNGIRTVDDILNTTWHMMKQEDTKVLLGLGYFLGILSVKNDTNNDYALKFVDHDMFGRPYSTYILNKMLTTLYKSFGDEQMNMLLPQCDGTKTIDEISTELQVEKEIISFVATSLIKMGALVLVRKTTITNDDSDLE